MIAARVYKHFIGLDQSINLTMRAETTQSWYLQTVLPGTQLQHMSHGLNHGRIEGSSHLWPPD